MGRWTQFEEDAFRLPEGMKRVAYDADTRVYTFKDRDGKLFRGPPGDDYGTLTPVPKSTTITRRGAFADSDAALARQSIEVDPTARSQSFEDFLPTHVITKATSPIDTKPLSPLSSSPQKGFGEKRASRLTFKDAVRKTALPKMQGVVHNLRRSMTTTRRNPRNGEDSESNRLLRDTNSVDLSRNASVATSRTAVSRQETIVD